MPSKHMQTKTKSTNPYRIPAAKALREEGFTDPIDYIRHAEWEGVSRACCSEGCEVEPDGRCSHGCPALSSILFATLS